MPRDLDYGFDNSGMGQRRPQGSRQPMQGGPSRQVPQGGRRKKNQTGPIIILAVEIVVFIALLVAFFILKGKIEDGDLGSDTKSSTEASAESGSSGGVNVENENFSLTCTKVQLATDVDGNPAALIYFTYTNKSSTPLSMSEVFPPRVTQNGMDCSTDIILAQDPPELANKDTQISDGQSLECCYAFSLQDLTSTLTLTTHDNYSTFTDIGSTEIPLS